MWGIEERPAYAGALRTLAGVRGATRLCRGAPNVWGVWGAISGPPISNGHVRARDARRARRDRPRPSGACGGRRRDPPPTPAHGPRAPAWPRGPRARAAPRDARRPRAATARHDWPARREARAAPDLVAGRPRARRRAGPPAAPAPPAARRAEPRTAVAPTRAGARPGWRRRARVAPLVPSSSTPASARARCAARAS